MYSGAAGFSFFNLTYTPRDPVFICSKASLTAQRGPDGLLTIIMVGGRGPEGFRHHARIASD